MRYIEVYSFKVFLKTSPINKSKHWIELEVRHKLDDYMALDVDDRERAAMLIRQIADFLFESSVIVFTLERLGYLDESSDVDFFFSLNGKFNACKSDDELLYQIIRAFCYVVEHKMPCFQLVHTQVSA